MDSSKLLRLRIRRLEVCIKTLIFLWIILASLFSLFVFNRQVNSEDIKETLRLRRLAIVDENGTERVVISAPVPDPISLGKRLPRGGKVSGVLLFDAEGNERSGYVTADGYPNVMFTLDDLSRQRTLFMTEPHGSTSFWLFADNGNSFQLNVNGESSHFKVKNRGKVTTEQPSVRGGKK